MNPPDHAKLMFDFFTVDDNKSLYKDMSLIRHVIQTITVKNIMV